MTALAAPYAARESRLLMAAVTDKRPSPGYSGRCVYCGCRTFGKACGSHSDLLLIEQQEFAA